MAFRATLPLERQANLRAPAVAQRSSGAPVRPVLSKSINSTSISTFLLQLQRDYGNRHVQQVIGLFRKDGAESEVTPAAQSAIEGARGGGQPLDKQAQLQMESAFGTDFSAVRVHTDGEADRLNGAVNAIAFTTGQDIFFRSGEYQPQNSAGRELLAHELTHVVQQRGVQAQGKLQVGAADDGYEQEAERVARSVTARLRGAEVQRKCDCGGHEESGGDCEECRERKLANEGTLQRVRIDANGQKTFDCADYAGDTKLEACLNDQDRLNPGTRGATVTKVQNGLLKDGADLGKEGADGVYGPATARAVMAFKAKYRLGFEQYSDVGPGTMAKLDELCAAKPSPTPAPPTPVKPGQCFDTIDWNSFFEERESECAVNQSSIDAICALAPNSPFNLGPDPCPKAPLAQRVEDCVTDAGFLKLFETCGIPASGGPGKSEIRKRFEDWRKKKP